MGDIDSLLREGQRTVVAWLLVGVLLLAVGENVLDGDPLWAGFAAVAATVALIPPVLRRDRSAIVPWEVVALTVLPILVRSLFAETLLVQLATYLSVTAVALIAVVELSLFTSLAMTAGFAVALVVTTTMATAGTWAIVQWFSDRYLGTAFLGSPDALMWDLVIATGMGVLGGVVFALYFYRHDAIRAPGTEDWEEEAT